MQHDCAIVGGGVIGLSIAWRLARRGCSVILLDRGQVGREASWAGAGILPPGPDSHVQHPYDQLRASSAKLHPEWAQCLLEETGIDNGYNCCGGLYFARHPGESAALRGWRLELNDERIPFNEVSAIDLATTEPNIDLTDMRFGLSLPGEAQIRNPRHLKALTEAGRRCGVEFRALTDVQAIRRHRDKIVGLETSVGLIEAKTYCFAAGAWTYPLFKSLNVPLEVVPIRGQMILFNSQQPLTQKILNQGSRYLVPRDDGRLLAGSCEEEAGYEKATTNEMLAQLREFAFSWLPELRNAKEENSWAGLRPGTVDGFPYLDRLGEMDNGFVAAGHFRSGLYLSPATAENMTSWILDGRPQISLEPFRILRR